MFSKISNTNFGEFFFYFQRKRLLNVALLSNYTNLFTKLIFFKQKESSYLKPIK